MGAPPSPQVRSEGLHFLDGKRKVDYVLVFHQRRHSSIRSLVSGSVSQDQLSVVSNGNFPPTKGSDPATGRGADIPGGEAASVGEVFMELGSAKGSEPMEAIDQEMHLIRQEFEANLLEAGLEIEREKEVGVPKVLLAYMLFLSSLFSGIFSCYVFPLCQSHMHTKFKYNFPKLLLFKDSAYIQLLVRWYRMEEGATQHVASTKTFAFIKAHEVACSVLLAFWKFGFYEKQKSLCSSLFFLPSIQQSLFVKHLVFGQSLQVT